MEREDRTGRKHRRVGWTLFWGLTVVAGFLFGVYHGERKSSTALFGRGGFSGKVDALQCPTCPRCEPTRCPDPASARECPRCEGGAVGSGAGSSFGASATRDAGGAKTTEAVGKTESGAASGTAEAEATATREGARDARPVPSAAWGNVPGSAEVRGRGRERAGEAEVAGPGRCACDECPVCKRPGRVPGASPCRT